LITLGIDPGTALLGYGVISGIDQPTMLAFGAVETQAGQTPAARLESIYNSLVRILDEHAPDVMAVEQLFFARNVTTALAVGQARGVGRRAPPPPPRPGLQ
jgi:crossover junction endodeoxyribonuclease RuvC